MNFAAEIITCFIRKRRSAAASETMPITAIVLLLISGSLHAVWNLLVKKSPDKFIIIWLSLLIGSLCFAPFLLVSQPPTSLPPGILLRAVLSAIFGAAYFLVLARSYEQADFSLVYPLARGTAPVLLAAWSILFAGEAVSGTGIFGLAILIFGLFVIGGKNPLGRNRAGSNSSGVKLALLTAFLLSAFSVIDAGASRQTDPLVYTVLIFFLTALIIAPYALRRYGWRKLKRVGAENPRLILAVGILTLASYGAALAAFAVAPLAYSGAIREVSVVLGALGGWLFLKEPFGLVRTLGAAVAFAGIAVIAFA